MGMKLLFKCLPTGDLPYESNELATKLIVKLFENIPFLANLPNMSMSENLVYRTLENIPGIKIDGKKVVFKESSHLKPKFVAMDAAFNNPNIENLEPYKMDTVFLHKYFQILDRIKPQETVVNLLGPFTISQMLSKDDKQMLADKYYRKFIIQAVCLKALWIIHHIKAVSPDTMPVIMLEEPLLNRVGDVKREHEEVTREVIVNLLAKVVFKIKEYQSAVGIQCFEKCDWKIPIEAGVDIISFDAYTNPNNLNIIPERVNNFLIGGGRINWAIVPVINEATVKALTLDYAYKRFTTAVDNLITAGVSERLAYNRATVSIQGDVNKLPLIFVEKAIIIANQLSKKIPVFRAAPKPDSNQ